MAVINLPALTKHASETRFFSVNLGPRLRPTDVINMVTAIEATPDGLTIDEISNTAGTCAFRVGGGEAGAAYLLTIRFDTEPPVQHLVARIILQLRDDVEEFSYAVDAPLAPWPTLAEDEAAAIARVCDALGVVGTGASREPRVRSWGATAAALVQQYAPDAPQAVRDEATIRTAGYLKEQPKAAVRSESVGPLSRDYAPSMTSALRHSGSMALLSRWKIRRAGIVG